MIRLGPEVAATLREGLVREWLETNSLGGFACGTVAGANTRRYHGLLVAAMRPPLGRHLLLAKVDEEVVVDGTRTPLCCNVYPGTVHPRGHERIVEFRMDPFPTWVFEVSGARIEKSIFLVHGEHTIVVSYRLLPGPKEATVSEALLELSPLLAYRDFHSLTHENPTLDARVRSIEGRFAFTPYAGLPTLYIEPGAERVEATGYWYRNFEYQREAEYVVDFREDVFCPCRLVYRLVPGDGISFVATLEASSRPSVATLRQREIDRRRAAATIPGETASDVALETLSTSADAFVVRRGESGLSVIAGYPWFADWGRSACVSLPGLTLERGRTREARQVLLTLANSRDQGLIPNFFVDETGHAEYAAADTSLWFVQAASEYVQATGDVDALRGGLYRAVSDVLRAYRGGARFGISVDSDGLLVASAENILLTWMSARVDEWAVTPRRGKAVEVNALWYAAHRSAAELAGRLGVSGEAASFADEAQRIGAAFEQTFWNPDRRFLYDVVDGDRRDPALRPNQIYAVALPHSPLPLAKQRAIVDVVRDQLLTPYGLRTLGPTEPGYAGIYSGNRRLRDAAYHQGSVWPFLIGAFVSAFLRVHGSSEEARRDAEGFLQPLVEWALGPGLGHIPELYDGDPPHKPRGCIAYAASVAEVLRAWRLVRRR